MASMPAPATAPPVDRALLAIAAAATAFGVSFGVLAGSVGLDAAQTVAMSALVFAGSAQFAAVAALDAGASALSAAVAGAALNLRYLPMGVALGVGLRGRRARRAVQAHLVVDESVALATGADGSVDERRFDAAGALLLASWTSGTALGALGGDLVGDPEALGLDAAFPALFLALIAPRLRAEAPARRAALAAVALAAAGVVVLPAGLATVVAAAGAVAGLAGTGRAEDRS
jgi:4-azaleucine resistance transporter AzlC